MYLGRRRLRCSFLRRTTSHVLRRAGGGRPSRSARRPVPLGRRRTTMTPRHRRARSARRSPRAPTAGRSSRSASSSTPPALGHRLRLLFAAFFVATPSALLARRRRPGDALLLLRPFPRDRRGSGMSSGARASVGSSPKIARGEARCPSLSVAATIGSQQGGRRWPRGPHKKKGAARRAEARAHLEGSPNAAPHRDLDRRGRGALEGSTPGGGREDADPGDTLGLRARGPSAPSTGWTSSRPAAPSAHRRLALADEARSRGRVPGVRARRRAARRRSVRPGAD